MEKAVARESSSRSHLEWRIRLWLLQTDALGRPKITRQSRTRLTRRRIVPANIWSLAHARADGCETDGEAGADGGERRDPHCAALAKAQRRRCLRVRMVHDGAFSVSLDSQIATRAQQGVSAKASLNRIPKLPPDRRAASKTAKLCLRFQNAKKQHACLGMRCLRGHQRHGAFSCRWLGAARSLCHLLRIKLLSAAWSPHEKAPAASAKQFAARRLRAAVVACGAVGARAARGAATKAVKSAPGTIYRRGSCHPEAD